MKSMVVLFALCAVACASWAPVAQPPHYPAIVLDPRGRPLDTAEVINARALHYQAKALEGHYGYAHGAVAAPVLAHAAPVATYGSTYWGNSGLGYAGYGHALYKRSLGHYAHAPVVAVAPAAVSHQSRVDVRTSPAVVAHTAVVPVAHHAPIAHAAVLPVPHHAPIAHAAVLPVPHHAPLARINHAAVAPIGYAAPYYSAQAW